MLSSSPDALNHGFFSNIYSPAQPDLAAGSCSAHGAGKVRPDAPAHSAPSAVATAKPRAGDK